MKHSLLLRLLLILVLVHGLQASPAVTVAQPPQLSQPLAAPAVGSADTAGLLMLDPTDLTFDANIGSTALRGISLHNLGSVTLTVDALQVDAASFVASTSVSLPITLGPAEGPGLPANSTLCSQEFQVCNFAGEMDVVYGAALTFTVRYRMTGPVDCGNDLFGDPVPGALKACYTRPPVAAPPFTNEILVGWAPTSDALIRATLLVSTSAGVVSATLLGRTPGSPQLSDFLINFPSTAVGSSSGGEIYLHHASGLGDLLIIGVSSDDPRFGLSSTLGLPFSLPADYNDNWLKIAASFAPDASGALTATGTITTSRGVLTFPLYGTGVQPIPFVVSPVAITATMFATQTSITRQFVVTNTGSQTLTLVTTPHISFDPNIALGNVAYIHTHSDTQASAIVSALLGSGLLQTVTAINLLTHLPGVAELENYDALLVGGVKGPYAGEIGNHLLEYAAARGGGVVLIGGALRSDECIRGPFLSYTAYVFQYPCDALQHNITETLSGVRGMRLHPVMRGVNQLLRPRNSPAGYTPHVASAVSTLAYFDFTNVVGNAYPVGHNLYGEDVARVDLNFDPVFTECDPCGWQGEGARLMANALRYTMGREFVRSVGSPVIGPGKTATTSVTLYGQVPSGTHHAELHFAQSGLPASTILPISLTVQGPPAFVFNSSVDFGNVYIGQFGYHGSGFVNAGASSIEIYSITTTMPYARIERTASTGYWTLANASFSNRLAPWSTQHFKLVYEPLAAGLHTGVLTIATSLGARVIPMTGRAADDIEVRAAPDSVRITTTWNAQHVVPYSLTNLSTVTAAYTVTESSIAIMLSGALTGTLAAGETRADVFTAALNTTAVLPGLYAHQLLLGQSDAFNAAERTGDALPFVFNVLDRYLSVAPASLAYTHVVVGVPVTRSIFISNQGNLPLTISGLPHTNPDWTAFVTLPVTLAAGHRLTIPLVLLPSQTGAFSDTITVESDAPQARDISLTALMILTPVMQLNPLSFDEIILDDEQRVISITLENTGLGTLALTATSSSPTNLTLATGSVVLAPATGTVLTGTIKGNTIAISSTQHYTIVVSGNDPATPTLSIPLTVRNSGRPLPPTPTTPADAAANISADTALAWSKPANATGVRARLWLANETAPTAFAYTSTANAGSYNPTGYLQQNRAYAWQLESYNTYGGTPGPTRTFTTEKRIDLIAPVIGGPDFAWSNGVINISWVVSNAGALTASVTWADRVYISSQPEFDGSVQLLGQRNNIAALAPGQGYASNLNVTIPTGTQGQRYIFVKADGAGVFNDGTDREYSANNSSPALGLTITLTPPPDLLPTALVAPLDAFSQQTLAVAFVISNASAVTTPIGAWQDRLYLSTDTVCCEADVVLLTHDHNAVLTPGQAYSVNANVVLPKGISGTHYLLLETDYNNALFEYVGETNNERSSDPLNIVLRPPPDLRPTGIAVSGVMETGQPFTVVFTITNFGPGETDASSWVDRIYRSTSAAQSGLTQLAGLTHNGVLAPGASYSVERTFTWPVGLPDTYYLHLKTDTNDAVYEHLNEHDNWGLSEPISVVLGGAPDLLTEDVQLLSAASVTQGRSIDLAWRVHNIGELTSAGTWLDQARIRRQSTGQQYLLGNVTRPHGLAAGEAYTQQRSFKVGAVPAGDYDVLIQTDQLAQIHENGRDANNTAQATGVTLTVSAALVSESDLLASELAISDAPASGQLVTLSWQVTNTLNSTNVSVWHDTVILRMPGGAGVVEHPLKDRTHSGSLYETEGYVASVSVRLPTGVSGAGELILRVDAENAVNDIDRSDNVITLPVTITLSPWPDLAPAAVPQVGSGLGGSSWYLGFTRTVTWSVVNLGAGVADATWLDRLYLSDDAVLSGNDVVLSDLSRTSDLAAGASYTRVTSVTAADVVAGSYYLILKTDRANQVFENTDEANNIGVAGPFTITPAPAADLVVDDVTVLSAGELNAGQTIALHYVLRNAGVERVNASVCTLIHVSVDAVWGLDDALLAEQCMSTVLAMGASVTRTLSQQLPVLEPGMLRLIARTDTRLSVPEADEVNNSAVSAPFTISVPSLTLGVPLTTHLLNGQAADFQIALPAGAAIEILLNGSESVGSSELYVRLGAPASRNAYDFLSSGPNLPDQSVLIPATVSGTYFVRVYANSGKSAAGSETLLARQISFGAIAAAPGSVGNAGASTLDIVGALFDANTTFTLSAPNGVLLGASKLANVSDGRAFATFALAGAMPGSYALISAKPGHSATLTNALQVVAGTGSRLEASIQIPATTRRHGDGNEYFQRVYAAGSIVYRNVGDADMTAPVFWVKSPEGGELTLGAAGSETRAGIHAIGLSPDGPATVLRPGASGSVPFLIYTPWPTRTFSFDMWWATADDARSSNRPLIEGLIGNRNVFTAQTKVFERDLATLLGDTMGSYNRAIADQAAVHEQGGERVFNAAQLLEELVRLARGASGPGITGRIVADETGIGLGLTEIVALGASSINTDTYTERTFTDASGYFTISSVMPGAYYLWLMGGRVINPVPRVTVTLAASANAGTLAARQVISEPERVAEPDLMAPVLLTISATQHMAFASDGALYHTWRSSGSWSPPAKVGEGRGARLVHSDHLFGAGKAGLALLWTNGFSNDQRIEHSTATWTDGAWQWISPTLYFSGTVGSANVDVALAADGAPVAAWQMRNRAQPDDSDLYFRSGALAAPPALRSIGQLALLSQPVRLADGRTLQPGELLFIPNQGPVHALGRLAAPPSNETEISFSYSKSLKRALPDPIPFVGKTNKMEWTVNASGKYGTNGAKAAGGINGALEIYKPLIKANFAFGAEALWSFNKKECKMEAEALKLEGELVVQAYAPMYMFKVWKIAEVAVGLSGSLNPKVNLIFNRGSGGVEGNVTVDVGVGGFAYIYVFNGMFEAEGRAEIKFRFRAITDQFPNKFVYSHAWFHAYAGVGGEVADGHAIGAQWEYKYSEDGAGDVSGGAQTNSPLALARRSLIANQGQVTQSIVLKRPQGSTQVYGANTLNPLAATDVDEDGAPVLVSDGAGRVHAFWVRHPFNVDLTLGRSIAHSIFTGGAWSAAEILTGTAGLIENLVSARAANGDLMLSWLQGDASGLTLASDPALVLQRLLPARPWFMRYSASDGWSTPAQMPAAVSGTHRRLNLNTGFDQQLIATWQQRASPDADAALVAIIWNGSAWSPVKQVAFGNLNGAATASDRNGATELMWSQSITRGADGPPVSRLFAAVWDGFNWSVPAEIDPFQDAAPLQREATAEAAEDAGAGSQATYWALEQLDFDFGIPAEWCDEDESDDPDPIDWANIQPPCTIPQEPEESEEPETPTAAQISTLGRANVLAMAGALTATPPPPTPPPPPPKPRCPPNGGGKQDVLTAQDPNDISGPASFGDAHWIPRAGDHGYVIRFENDPALASAAAQRVVVTHALDADIDANSFRVGAFGFGALAFTPPANRAYHSARLGPFDIEVITGTTHTLAVDVLMGLDVTTREAFWIFQTIDPDTGAPPLDPASGFLPPDWLNRNGEGFVNFSVRANPDAGTGAVIDAVAAIRFDQNALIWTPAISHTLDAERPTSMLAPLPPATSGASIPLQLSASDGGLLRADDTQGSGVRNLALYVAIDHGPFGLWSSAITSSQMLFPGLPGHHYAFYVLAQDNVGQIELGKGIAEAQTDLLPAPTPSPTVTPSPTATSTPTATSAPTMTSTPTATSTPVLSITATQTPTVNAPAKKRLALPMLIR